MKKKLKIIMISVILIILLILIDTMQAKLLDNSPVLKVIDYCNGGNLYKKDIGILVNTYTYTDGTKKTTFKWNDYDNNQKSNIPNDYISVFHGGSGEIIYETYIYKIMNGKENSGFNYINVTKTTDYYGSSKWNTKITKHGSVQWTDDVFVIAKENNAYSYVTIPNNDRMYTIEEYQEIFLMN